MRALPTLPYQPNPYHARMHLASRLAGGLGDDGEALPGIDLLESPAATPVDTTDFVALTAAQDATYLPAPAPEALPTPAAATPLAPAATAAGPSFDWSKLLSSVIQAGGAVTTGVIQGQTAQNIARTQYAQAASGQNALAQQAALLKGSLSAKLAALPSWLPWALGGGTILVIGFFMVRKHSKP